MMDMEKIKEDIDKANKAIEIVQNLVESWGEQDDYTSVEYLKEHPSAIMDLSVILGVFETEINLLAKILQILKEDIEE